MTDLEALLEAIYAAPDDDAPRLVYADALSELGDPRGEFIVRQCRGDTAAELVLLAHGDAWLGELEPVIGEYTFERGFLATAKIVHPRDDAAIARLVGHPAWSTVRALHGSAAIGVHPTMRALRVLGVDNEPALWRELLITTPRPIVELDYWPSVTEDWDNDGDITATPHSGGAWRCNYVPDELDALSRCVALPKLRKLSLGGLTGDSLARVLAGPIVDRIPAIDVHDGPVSARIAGGLAVITVPQQAGNMVNVMLELVRGLPVHLGIELVAPPHFAGRAMLEQMVGPRLRQGTRR